MTLLLASLAGAVGAVCRYAVSGWAQRASRSDFPVGTLAVNLVGSFLVGATVGIDQLGSETSLMAVGFLGGFTTFSTWMVETIRLGFPRSFRASASLLVSLIAGVALAAAGYSLTN
jgi:CrcB protein